MNKEKLDNAIEQYIKYVLDKNNQDEVSVGLDERNEREDFYQKYNKEKIKIMDEKEIFEYISKLWAMIIWGNKQYIIDKIINDNGFENLKNQLANLLYGTSDFEKRWDTFKDTIKGFGPAMMSELLCYVNPNEYMLWNRATASAYGRLEVKNVPKHNYQITGKKYTELTTYAKNIQKKFIEKGYEDADLLFVDYFLWEQSRDYKQSEEKPLNNAEKISVISNKSYHNEVIENIKNIGIMLGYNTDKTCRILDSGKVADAVWEFNVGNIGQIKYVFEVQDSGSIDSLIVSLMNASQDISVQAVIAVSDGEQINKIKKHCNNISSSFNGKLKFWDISAVEKTNEDLTSAMEIINGVLKNNNIRDN